MLSVILLAVISVIVSGRHPAEFTMNFNGYKIQLSKTTYAEDEYLYYIQSENGIIEAKLFDHRWFTYFHTKEIGNDFLEDKLNVETKETYGYLELNDLYYGEQEHFTCLYDTNGDSTNHKNCEGTTLKKAKELEAEYNEMLKDMGVTHQSLIDALKYKQKNPFNKWLWS